MRYLFLCLFLVGCGQSIEAVQPVPDFDHTLAAYAKSEFHTGDDFDRVAVLVDAWCQSLGAAAVDSKACEFLDSTLQRGNEY